MADNDISMCDAAEPKWVVVATPTAWSELPRLRHQVTRALSRHYRVLYIHFDYEWRHKHRSSFDNVEPNIAVWRPVNYFTTPERVDAGLPFLCSLEMRVLRASLQRLLSNRRIRPIAVVNFDYRHHWIQHRRLFPRAIYICNDDFPGLVRRAGKECLARRIAQQMRNAARHADVCLAVSEHIARILDVGDKAKVFQPGHDFSVPKTLPADTPKRPDCTKVGYMGSIDNRLNLEWIRHAASQPGIEWHMIGPVKPPETGAALASYNVQLHSPLTGQALLEWLQAVDVLTIPFDLPPDLAPAFANPNKTFFYLAAGKPIVVPDLPGFLDLGMGSDIIYRADSAEEFVAQIRRAHMEDDAAKTSRRLEIAREHTWENRIRILCDLLEPGNARAVDTV